jgi:glutamate racemase
VLGLQESFLQSWDFGLPRYKMIGIFDSGLGGLTVLDEILKRSPQEDIVYIGDTARVPWGGKKPDTIKHLSFQLTKFLLRHNVERIIVACHTASSVAMDTVRSAALGISVTGMIEAGVKAAVKSSKSKKIGLVGTKATINSNSWSDAIKSYDHSISVFSKECPLFVPIIEENLINAPFTRDIIEFYLDDIKSREVDTLILACTHYPFIERQIESFLGKNITIINPGKEVAKELMYNKSTQGELKLYFTDMPKEDSVFLNLGGKIANAKIQFVPLEDIEK